MYKSTFLPEKEIDLPNYLTEILIRNYLRWLKKRLPQCPFWRKEIYEQHPEYKDLAQRYITELAAVKKLLLVFDPETIAQDFSENNRIGFQRIKKVNQNKIIVDLYNRQIKNKKNKTIVNKPKEKEFSPEKKSFKKTNIKANV